MEKKDIKYSVAIATYNGEKYIAEQLRSILSQSVPIDEIVVSDDGSTDNTLSIVNEVLQETSIEFSVLNNNQRHCPCGNFEWAIRHCHGEIIFLSDQDDVWLENKVEKVIEVFNCYPETLCVIHDASLINGVGENIFGQFDKRNLPNGKLIRDKYLEQSVSMPLANGMVMCIKKELAEQSMPFPETNNFHDQWLIFSALCKDGLYRIDEVLELYRLHGANYSGNSAYKGTVIDRLRKFRRRIKKNKTQIYENYLLGNAMKNKLEIMDFRDSTAYSTACRVYSIGEQVVNAYKKPRFVGAGILCKMYFSDIRYRRIGRNNFIYELIGVLLK